MEKHRVAIVGCGNMGQHHLQSVIANPKTRPISLVDVDIKRAENLAERFRLTDVNISDDFHKILDNKNIDIVIITTPPASHCEIAVKFMEAGKCVLCEKPMAENLENAQLMIDVAKRTAKKLLIGYIYRFTPAFQEIAKIVHQNIGKPMVIRTVLNQQFAPIGYSPESAWEKHKILIAHTSPLVDCGCHHTDLFRWFTRAEPKSIYATAVTTEPDTPEGKYNWGMMIVEMTDGSVGYCEIGWGKTIRYHWLKEICGPGGWVREIIAKRLPEEEKSKGNLVEYYIRGEDTIHRKFDGSVSSGEPFKRELEFLINAMERDLDLSDHLKDAYISLQMVLLADESIKTGRVIEIGD